MSEQNTDSFDPMEKRMESMMMIIDTTLLSLDTSMDQLMLACAMMQRSREIFDGILGEEGRKKMFEGLA